MGQLLVDDNTHSDFIDDSGVRPFVDDVSNFTSSAASTPSPMLLLALTSESELANVDTGPGTGNYALLLALTSESATSNVDTGPGGANYALLLALTSQPGTPPPEPTPRRGGGTYLTQAELRRLRKQLDAKEAKDRAAQDRQLRTITQAYDDIVHPEIRIARDIKQRARQAQDQIEQEEEEFLLFLLDNYDTLH